MIICKYYVPLRILGKINIIKTSLIEKINNNFGTNLCNIPGSFLLFFNSEGKNLIQRVSSTRQSVLWGNIYLQ